MASDEAVIATNDEAALCKRYAVEKGYWADPYISLFVPRPSNIHTPEINRGYFVRVMGTRHLLEKFLRLTNCNCQVINLGAGFDTTYFHLKDVGLAPKSFVEIDFPTVTSKKCHFLKSREPLLQKVAVEGGTINCSASELHGPDYHIVAANLRNITEVDSKLTASCIDRTLPTIFIAECVLVYIETEKTDQLLAWLAHNFQTVFFINYEQVNMADRFGQVMIDNLKSRNCILAGVSACESIETQKNRFLSTGWHSSDALEVSHIYASLPQSDIQRIEKLEFLDERELMDQLFSHYCFAWSYKDPNNLGLSKINFANL